MGGRERSEACFWSCCERPKAEGKAARVARPPHPALCATFSRRREKGCQVRAATHSGPGHNVQTHDAAALPPPIRIPMPDTAPDQPASPALEVTGLGKRVSLPSGELTILDDIGFRIAAGDSVAIVGAPGSGKSTLLSLMAGLDAPSSGEVRLDGAPMSTPDEDGRPQVRADKVGFVFPSCKRLPELTAQAYVVLPRGVG